MRLLICREQQSIYNQNSMWMMRWPSIKWRSEDTLSATPYNLKLGKLLKLAQFVYFVEQLHQTMAFNWSEVQTVAVSRHLLISNVVIAFTALVQRCTTSNRIGTSDNCKIFFSDNVVMNLFTAWRHTSPYLFQYPGILQRMIYLNVCHHKSNLLLKLKFFPWLNGVKKAQLRVIN